MDSISISLSGLQAQSKKLSVAASNIANVQSNGSVENNTVTDPSSPTVYKPLIAQTSSIYVNNQGVGVETEITERPDSVSFAYDPNSVFANKDGYISVPNIDLAEEIVSLITIEIAYKANIKALQTSIELEKSLLDTFI